MSNTDIPDELIDRAWMEEMMIRWHLAALGLDFIEPNAVPTAPALRRLIADDIPLLVKEVLRLRPDLRTCTE